MRVVGLDARLRFNPAHPDGTPRKLLDSNRLLGLGWRPGTSLEEGIGRLYAWFLESGHNEP
jgi:GDP-L-fucose synthase